MPVQDAGPTISLFLAEGQVNEGAFVPELRWCNVLPHALKAAIDSGSPSVESTHFLVALAGIPGGITQVGLAARRLTAEAAQSGLRSAADRGNADADLAELNRASLHDSAIRALELADRERLRLGVPLMSESILLHAVLENLTPRARALLEAARVDVEAWCQQLTMPASSAAEEPLEIFDEHGQIRLDAFSSRARRLLVLMQREAQALGYEKVDARHLLVALLADQSGALPLALHAQGIDARQVHGTAMLNLKSNARRTRSTVLLAKTSLQGLVVDVLHRAAQHARHRGLRRVGEPYVARAFLDVDTVARSLLFQARADVARLTGDLIEQENATATDEGPAEEADSRDPALADIDSVRAALRRRLVGQDEAIELILPCVQRMRFGFRVPGRPVGVFLFCGPSGSGKTETAKELARSVFGSEEKLLYLEMGQFNAPESMNIFVGAAPGYKGYGEGKLTNWLRDNPQSVVLFDEVEKAHAKVHDALLRFLDEGKIDDPAGPVRDGSECLVILTSNVGSEELAKPAAADAADVDPRDAERARLRTLFRQQRFRVEFLNRVDEIVLFRPLDQRDYVEIAQRLLNDISDRLRREHSITLQADARLIDRIGVHCVVAEEGARAALRLVKAAALDPAIDFVLRNGTGPMRLRVSLPLDLGPLAAPRGVVERLS